MRFIVGKHDVATYQTTSENMRPSLLRSSCGMHFHSEYNDRSRGSLHRCHHHDHWVCRAVPLREIGKRPWVRAANAYLFYPERAEFVSKKHDKKAVPSTRCFRGGVTPQPPQLVFLLQQPMNNESEKTRRKRKENTQKYIPNVRTKKGCQ